MAVAFAKEAGLPDSFAERHNDWPISPPRKNAVAFSLDNLACRRLLVHECTASFTSASQRRDFPLEYWNSVARFYSGTRPEFDCFMREARAETTTTPSAPIGTHDAQGNLVLGPLSRMYLDVVDRQLDHDVNPEPLPPVRLTAAEVLEKEEAFLYERRELFEAGHAAAIIPEIEVKRVEQIWEAEKARDEESDYFRDS